MKRILDTNVCIVVLRGRKKVVERLAARPNAALLNHGTPVGITDVFIAATGLCPKWTVATNNTKDFRGIDGLTLEDWR